MDETRMLRLEVRIDLRENVAVVTVDGEVDLATASALADGIAQAVSTSPSAVIVDLSAVGFLGSVGMSVLIKARRTIGSAAQFVVVADGPYTRRPMELVGLDATIPIHPDLAAALSAVGGDDGGKAADILTLPPTKITGDDDEAEESIA